MRIHTTTIVASALVALSGLCASTANAQFNFNNFNGAVPVVLNGAAAVTPGIGSEGNVIALTPPATHVAGSFWHNTKQQVATGFVTDFTFRIRERSGLGADGITFTIQNQGSNALGGTGGALGFGTNDGPFVPPQTHTGITNSVSVAFDCWDNSGDWNTLPGHNQCISVQTNGLLANRPESQYALGGVGISGIFNDATVKTARIVYTPGTLSIFYQNLVTPILTVPLDLDTTLALSAGTAYVGFTGATGGADNVQRQEVLSWSFTNVVPAPGAAAVLGLGGLAITRRRRIA
jgi:hypothetical protein